MARVAADDELPMHTRGRHIVDSLIQPERRGRAPRGRARLLRAPSAPARARELSWRLDAPAS
eukprot:3081521-Alexandrium_andersonii.AAC.1